MKNKSFKPGQIWLDADKTFYAQSAFVLPVVGKPGAFIAMFDRWNKHDLRGSRYVWLPVSFEDEQVKIHWYDEWAYLSSKITNN